MTTAVSRNTINSLDDQIDKLRERMRKVEAASFGPTEWARASKSNLVSI